MFTWQYWQKFFGGGCSLKWDGVQDYKQFPVHVRGKDLSASQKTSQMALLCNTK